ncbi:MAG: hypothetical protein JJE47_15185 [Acidimicrobiia bacterium]|nr:hypothetical protein [Acidimicrobiia bacterium]
MAASASELLIVFLVMGGVLLPVILLVAYLVHLTQRVKALENTLGSSPAPRPDTDSTSPTSS